MIEILNIRLSKNQIDLIINTLETIRSNIEPESLQRKNIDDLIDNINNQIFAE